MVIMETRNVESIFTIVDDGQKERQTERDQRRNAKRRTKV